MIVVANGNVDSYCNEQGMVISERYTGDLLDYKGQCPVIVTDIDVSKNEYFYLKYRLLLRKVELISVKWVSVELSEFVAYITERELQSRKNRAGRLPFGQFRRRGEIVEDPVGMAVVRRILDLRDNGATYSQIQADPDVHHYDGRKMSISTIQVILKNRDKYGK